jgi:hypothetical protein
MPGATRIRAGSDGGAMKGGAPRTVWQAIGSDPRIVTAPSAARYLDQLGHACHLVWNPLDGEIVQLIPVVRAGRSLGWPEGPDQLPEPAVPGWACPPPAGAPLPELNSEGRLCVQICVIAFAWEPFTAGPMTGLQEILDWLDSWRMPRTWPAGRPASFPHGHASERSRRLWSRGGHFGASQVPGWMAGGPGAVDVERLTGPQPVSGSRQAEPHHAEPHRVEPHRVEPHRVEHSVAELAPVFDRSAASSLTRVG